MTTMYSARTGQADSSPPELSGVIPREVRLTGAGIALTAVAIAMAAGAVASAIVMSMVYMQAEERRQLREREGTPTQAEIVDVVSTRGEHPRRIVTYRFRADGRSYVGKARLAERDRREVARGARMTIGYVASHPEMNWVVGYEPDSFPFFLIPLVSISLLVLSAFTGKHVRQQWTLLSEGRVAQARVTAHKRIQTDKRKGYRVSCEFQDLSGATRTARYDAGKTPPPIGAVVSVVYHRDNPLWTATYPLQLVRPARMDNGRQRLGGSGRSSTRRNSTSVPSA